MGAGEGRGVAQSDFELRTLSTVFYRLHTTLYFVVVVAFPNWQLTVPDARWFLLENGGMRMRVQPGDVELAHLGRTVELEGMGGVCLGSINRLEKQSTGLLIP